MAEDEETVEVERGRETTATGDTDGATFDSAAESFLALEADLEDQMATDEDTGPGQFRGLVVDAERVDASAVPEEYPVEIETDRAIALRVDRGSGETTVYLEWPGESGADAPLARLLAAMGIDLSDLYGREVLLERVDGHDILVVPAEQPRGSDTWGPVLAAGHVLNAGLVGLLFATGGLATPLFGLWTLLTVVGLPYATYGDGWYVRTHSDWNGGPLFWAALSMLPMLNSLAGVAYFWSRSRVRFFGDEPSLLGAAVAKVRSWL